MNRTVFSWIVLVSVFLAAPAMPAYSDDTSAPPAAADPVVPPANSAPPSTAQQASPSAENTAPASGAELAASESTSVAPQVPAPKPVLQYKELNPAFIWSPEVVQTAVKKGQEAAKNKKTADDLLNRVTQLPNGVRGRKGRSHESRVLCWDLNAFRVMFQTHRAAINYDPDPIPDWVKQKGYALSKLTFRVVLQSVPQVAANAFQSDRFANEGDVRVTKFVLTDDQGHIIPAIESKSEDGVKSGSLSFSGVTRIPHTVTKDSNVTANATGNTTANASAYGSGGYATANGTSNSTANGTAHEKTTYTYTEEIPWSVARPYYTAIYNVAFPLFDKDGNAVIKADSKNLTLHIITENGEMDTEYKLEPPKP